MADHRASVVVVGSINSDLTVTVERHPRPGETLTGHGVHQSPGGKGANQALAARLAGAETTFIGAVGDDTNADDATVLLRRFGVGLDTLVTIPGPTGLAVITVDDAGENSIIVVAGANGALSESHVRHHRDVITAADVVITQCEISTAAITAAANLARGRFILNLAPVTDVPIDVLRRADPLVVNEHEARGVLEYLAGTAPGEPEHVADGIRRYGVPAVVITLGSAGALVVDPDGVTRVPSESVSVVDTTGAGDAFVGTLGARLAAGDELRDATAQACRAGALATTAPGAQDSYVTALQALRA